MTACCTDTTSMVHQRLAHADEAALHTAGGACWARTRTRSRTSWCAPACHRPPTSLPSTTSCWGPPFRVRSSLAVLGHPQGGSIVGSSTGLRETCACQRRHECGVAAEGPSSATPGGGGPPAELYIRVLPSLEAMPHSASTMPTTVSRTARARSRVAETYKSSRNASKPSDA